VKGRAIGALIAGAALCLIGEIPAAQAQREIAIPLEQRNRPGYHTSIDPSGAMIMRLRDNFGRPCIKVRGFIRRNSLLTEVKEHMIEATNKCARPILLRVCYLRSAYCIDVRMSSFATKVASLGAMNNVVYFQFTFTEKAI
jgi:hypothetical protein